MARFLKISAFTRAFRPPRSDEEVPMNVRFPCRPAWPALLLTLLLFALPAWSHDPAEDDTVRLVRDLGPSVVAVYVTLEDVRIFPGAAPTEQQGGGSGFVVDQQGRIITNFHVVAAALREDTLMEGSLELRDNATIAISFIKDPEKEYQARILGANVDYDLALLELLEGQDPPKVKPLPLGDSDKIQAGEKAIAIGSPFGLQSTVTTGVVSAIEREQPGLVGIEIPFIQSDAAINPGNSGGPLFNARGEVIGINNAILASPMGPQAFVGVGFAVPVNLLKESMKDLEGGGLSGVAAAAVKMPERPRMGLTAALGVEDYPPELRQSLELPEHGVVVGDVSPGSPAEKAGIIGATDAVFAGGEAFPTGGDIITAADGQEVERAIQLQQVILARGDGDVVSVTLWRDGKERQVNVKLEVVPLEEEAVNREP